MNVVQVPLNIMCIFIGKYVASVAQLVEPIASYVDVIAYYEGVIEYLSFYLLLCML